MALCISNDVASAADQAGGICEVVDADGRRYYVVAVDAVDDKRHDGSSTNDQTKIDRQAALIKTIGQKIGWDDPAMDVYDNYGANLAKLKADDPPWSDPA